MGNIKFADLGRFVDVGKFGGLHGIQYDLDSAARMAEHLIKLYEPGFPGGEIVDGLSTAIVVRYSRAFVGGVRDSRPAKEALADLNDDQRALHEALLTMRDKHIAHSVNAQEETRVVAQYYEERVKEEGFVSVTVEHSRTVGFSREELEAIVDVARTLLRRINERIEEEEKRLLPSPGSFSAAKILGESLETEFPSKPPALHKRRKTP